MNEESAISADPSHIEIEKAVIGAMLMQGTEACDICAEAGMTPEWFAVFQCRHSFEIILTMHNVDLPLYLAEVKNAGVESRTGGANFAMECCDLASLPHNLKNHIQTMERAYKLRRIASIAHTAAQDAREGKDPDTIMDELSGALNGVGAASDGVSASESMDDNITVLENAFNGKASGLPLPWDRLTAATGGAQLASVIPLVGRDGKGKSGALAQILDYWAGQGIPTLAFSLEDVKRRVLLRMGGNRMQYSARTIETGRTFLFGRSAQITEYDRDALKEKMLEYKAFLDSAPFWIHDEPHTVEQIASRIRHYKRTKGIKAAAIDGFKDIIFTKGKTTNEAQNHISQTLCGVAKECNIALIVVSHIRKTDDNLAISKQDITGASSQFQGARQVMIFQDAGVDGVDGIRRFALDCCKSNFAGGGMVLLERNEDVLTYKETN